MNLDDNLLSSLRISNLSEEELFRHNKHPGKVSDLDMSFESQISKEELPKSNLKALF